MPESSRLWFTLAVFSLVVAGSLSLAVVIGRMPGISSFIQDPLFFRRCLVVHVNLALAVWFYAFAAALAAMGTDGKRSAWNRVLPGFAGTGVLLMLAGAWVPGAEPVLANYIPVIDHGLFLAGLGVFFIAVLGMAIRTMASPASQGGTLPTGAQTGARAAMAALLLAALTWASTQVGLAWGLRGFAYFELSAWGAGHVLQVANVAMMLAVWLWIVSEITGRGVFRRPAASVWFAVLLAPHLLAPLLALIPSWRPFYFAGSTLLMRWGIFPVVLLILAAVLHHLRRHGPKRPNPQARALLAGLSASIGLTLLGFLLGAMIRGSTTLVPAHYHAALGGVTAALMAAAYLIVAAAAREDGRGGLTPRFWTWARRQLILFGTGQAVFALGFGIGGAYGLGRKTYAAEQQARETGELLGLGVMGIGGLLATAAGLLFLVLIIREIFLWRGRRARAVFINPT